MERAVELGDVRVRAVDRQRVLDEFLEFHDKVPFVGPPEITSLSNSAGYRGLLKRNLQFDARAVFWLFRRCCSAP